MVGRVVAKKVGAFPDDAGSRVRCDKKRTSVGTNEAWRAASDIKLLCRSGVLRGFHSVGFFC